MGRSFAFLVKHGKLQVEKVMLQSVGSGDSGEGVDIQQFEEQIEAGVGDLFGKEGGVCWEGVICAPMVAR